jgi:hypothetical protein
MNEKLLNKIKALLAKANCSSVTEEEAKAFMAKATELMTKHGLQLCDLPEDHVERTAFEIDKHSVDSGRRKREYDMAVGRILSDCFGVKIVHWTGSSTYGFYIIGTAEDAAVAKEILPMLQATMSRGFLRWQRENGITKWSSNEARAFYWGLHKGYVTASEEGKAKALEQATKDQQQQYGIILHNKDQAIQLWAAANMKTKPLKAETLGSKNGAYEAGFIQGATLKLIQPKKLK